MAPELISGMARTPSRLTDLHSLSVLLFQMLVGEHPLNGKKEYEMSFEKMEEADILSELYGLGTACFIFKDENDLDKYIVPAEPAHANAKVLWSMYPDFIRRLFTRAFTEGIRNPHDRPLSNEWTDAFIKLFGLLYVCPKCGMSHLYDRELFYNSGGTPACSKCGTNVHVPRIKVGDNVVLITDRSVLYISSLAIPAHHRFTPVLEAEVKGGRLRFKNLSDYRVECHGMYAQKGAYTDYITSSDSISVNGKTYRIAL
jgi:DNA-binding helix-hairpin-helix protein with protein kinase domain